MRALWLCALVAVVSAETPEYQVHKMCRIPRLRAVKLREDGDPVEPPESVAGSYVQTDISHPLFYKCDDTSDWKHAVCDHGQWEPRIEDRCIVQTCRHENTEYLDNDTETIRCTKVGRKKMDVTVKCMGEYGYWSAQCGEGFVSRRRCGRRDCPPLYALADQPLQPILLNDKESQIILCPKGKTFEFCLDIDNCMHTNPDRYQIGNEVFSGMEIDQDSDAWETGVRRRTRYTCLEQVSDEPSTLQTTSDDEKVNVLNDLLQVERESLQVEKENLAETKELVALLRARGK